MRHEIDVALDLLETTRLKLRQLIEMTRDYEGTDAVHAQVDLGHAEHEVKRAISFVNRLVVNGKKPWDRVDSSTTE